MEYLKKNNYLILFTIYLLLVFFRELNIFSSPRLWAEEGTVHVKAIFENGLLGSILKPHLGYYSLLNNLLISIGVYFFGLELLPYFTTYVSFVFFVICGSSIFWLKSYLWDNSFKKSLILLAILIFCTGEMWMSVIYIQFYLGLFALLFGLSDFSKLNFTKLFLSALLILLGCLTGIVTIATAPIFIIRYFLKEVPLKLFLLVMFIFLIGLVSQLLILSTNDTFNGVARFSINYIENFPLGLGNTFIGTFFLGFGKISVKVFFGILFTLFSLKVFLNLNWRIRYLLPLFSSIYLGILFTFLSFKMFGGPRYGYISIVGFSIFLINILLEPKIHLVNNFKDSYLFTLLKYFFIFILSVNFVNFFDIKKFYDINWPKYSMNNIVKYPYGNYINIFPQWENYPEKFNYKLIISDKDLLKYRYGIIHRIN